jgi:hypothetical protein
MSGFLLIFNISIIRFAQIPPLRGGPLIWLLELVIDNKKYNFNLSGTKGWVIFPARLFPQIPKTGRWHFAEK